MLKVLHITITFLILSCSGDDNTNTTPTDPPTDPPPAEILALTEAANSPNQWHYVANEEMFSRAGNTTGYLANINPNSTKLLLYLQGGGACYNQETCNDNNNSFTDADGEEFEQNANQQSGVLFNRNFTGNAYRDWNYIFVPYSSGDVHSGNNSDGDVPNNGPQDQKMVGYSNVTKIVEDALEYWGAQGITEFIVTGSSAGGYGTYLNFIQLADAYPSAQKTALVDAGPMFLNDEVFDECLADVWNNLFKFQYPPDYQDVVQTQFDEDLYGIYEYLALKYPNANFGLMSDTRDAVIRFFFGYGNQECIGTTTPISTGQFENGLDQVRLHLENFENWHVFFVDDDEHTFLGGRHLTTVVNGKNMADWMEEVRNGEAADVFPN